MTAIRICLSVAALFMATAATAATDFPPLTGDVVDAAHVLSPATQKTLTDELAALRHKTGHRLVVATVPSLHGQAIETYGIRLFRTWQVGRTGQDDGAILIIAPGEHRDRIEVGYGLEATLTDAQSKIILHDTVRPYLQSGNYDGAALAGERAIATVLAPPPGTPAPPVPEPDVPWWAWLILLGFLGLIAGFAFLIVWAVRAAIRSAQGARAHARASHARGQAATDMGRDASQAGRAAADMAAAMAASMGAARASQSFEEAQEALRQKVEAMRQRPGTIYTRNKTSEGPEPAEPFAETVAAAETVAEAPAPEPASTMWETPVFATVPDPVTPEPYAPPEPTPVDDSRNYSGGTAGGGGASDSW